MRFLAYPKTVDEADALEREWIVRLRSRGVRLTNALVGGEGMRWGATPEFRSKVSEARRGRGRQPKSDLHRERISAALRAYKRTSEHEQNLRTAMGERPWLAELNRRRMSDPVLYASWRAKYIAGRRRNKRRRIEKMGQLSLECDTTAGDE